VGARGDPFGLKVAPREAEYTGRTACAE
jgi:hypothetical protein